MEKKRTVWCFGDSNTWGYDTSTRNRFKPEVRWTTLLENKLKEAGVNDIEVYNDGVGGRTIAKIENKKIPEIKTPATEYSFEYLKDTFFVSVLMIGTNDVINPLDISVEDIEKAMDVLLSKMRASERVNQDHILLVTPPYVVNNKKSEELHHVYSDLAKKYKIDYLNLADYIQFSKTIDPAMSYIHFSINDQPTVASAIYNVVKNYFDEIPKAE